VLRNKLNQPLFDSISLPGDFLDISSDNVEIPSPAQHQIHISVVLHNIFEILNTLSMNRKSHRRFILSNALIFIQANLNFVVDKLKVLSKLRETVMELTIAKKQKRVFSVVSEGHVLASREFSSPLRAEESSASFASRASSVTKTPERIWSKASMDSVVTMSWLDVQALLASIPPSSPEQLVIANELNRHYVSALLYILSVLWNLAGYENNVDCFVEAQKIIPLCLEVFDIPLALNERKVVAALIGLLSCLTYKGMVVVVG
jgi:hypothetical protein